MDEPGQQYLNQLESLVTQRQDWLFRFAYMRIGKREDAEDLIQDVFISLFSMIKDGREIKDLDHYILRSISNACADYHRKQKLLTINIDEADEIQENNPDKPLHDEFIRINKMLNELPPEQAETLRLKCYDNLTFRQIADLQEISESTVKSRYRYAIKYIQEHLKRHNNE